MALWSGLIAKPQRTPLKSRPSLTLYFLLIGAFLLTLVPHAVQFPVWLTLLIVGALLLRSIIEVYRLPLPSSTFCSILAVILFGLVWVQFSTIMGRVAGTALTSGLLTIKFFEIRRPRDIALIIFSCFFVVMSALLFSQVLELFIYCLIMMWILTALLMRVQAGDRAEDTLLPILGKSGLIFLQAIPLAAILFIFFPRVYGPIGLSLSDPPIGLTDTVSPGSVAKLARDDTPAMFVRFGNGSYPLAESMYWRAIVLYQYQKGVFTPGLFPMLPKEARPESAGGSAHAPSHDAGGIVQTITIFANNERWLYALDVPISAPNNTTGNPNWGGLYNGDTIQLNPSTGKLDHLSQYIVTSSLYRSEEKIYEAEWDASVQYPTEKKDGPIHPQVTALADKLYREAGGNTDAYIYAVLRYFHHGGFVYSIDLPPQGPDWLKEFLIDRKTGYCEHFATAFAVLMRIHQVPTRLVAGYVGGELNPYSGDYVVRQSNAHVWDEVWKPTNPAWKATDPTGKAFPCNGRWTRIDPTAIVSSEDAAVAASGSAGGGADAPLRVVHRDDSLADRYLPDWAKNSMREIRLRREELEMTWDNVVLSYDTEAQSNLARALGFGFNPMLKLLLLCLAAAAVCALVLWFWLTYKPKIAPVEILYAAFCRNMARRGVPRSPWEGPLAYTERVAEAFPDDLAALRSVGAIVARARYGPRATDTQALLRLQSALALLSASQAAGLSRDKR